MEPFLHGFILAFGLILPLGVQNIFVFSQGAVQPKLLRALPATITASVCDTLLIFLAVFGLSVIVLQLEGLRIGLMVVGVLFLMYMGYAIWKSEPAMNEAHPPLSARKQVIFALSVSLLNPHALLDTVGVIGTSALKYVGSEQFLFTLSCIMVSWIWFFSLSIAGAVMKKIDATGSVLKIFNKCSALFIWGTAIYLILELI